MSCSFDRSCAMLRNIGSSHGGIVAYHFSIQWSPFRWRTSSKTCHGAIVSVVKLKSSEHAWGGIETLLARRDNSSGILQLGGSRSPDELHGDGRGLCGLLWDGFRDSDVPRHARCLVSRFILQGWRMPSIVGRKNSCPFISWAVVTNGS